MRKLLKDKSTNKVKREKKEKQGEKAIKIRMSKK